MPTILGEKRDGEARLSNSNGSPVYEETWHFTIVADYATQPKHEILVNTPGFPIPGITTSAGGFAQCKSTSATRRTENSLYWDATAMFSSEVREGQNNQNPTTNPVEWVPVYETKFERLQEVVTKDQSGNTVANSAGQPFEVGLTVTRFIPVWDFFQFESASISDEEIIERNEVVNSAEFKGRAAKSLLCVVNSSVIGFYFGQRRRLTGYSLKYNERLWTHKRLDVGTQYLDSGNRRDYRSDPPDSSIMLGALNGSGGKQPVSTAPFVLNFDIYPTNSFSFLRI